MHRDSCFTGRNLVSLDVLNVVFNVHQSDVIACYGWSRPAGLFTAGSL